MLQVKCTSGDTTASVSGCNKGAVTLLSKEILKKDMLYLACRRHEYETIVEGVAVVCIGRSTSPEVKLFEKFQEGWKAIDVNKYDPGPTDEYVWENIDEHRQRVLAFAFKQLEV